MTAPGHVLMDDVEAGAVVQLRVLEAFGGIELAVRRWTSRPTAW